MELEISSNGAIALRSISPFFLVLLQSIVESAGSNDPRVENRLFPSPTSDRQEKNLEQDWKSLIQPELSASFLAAREVVQSDLRRVSEKDGEFSFDIPRNHVDAWLNALNQARLSIAEENHFGEADLSADIPQTISDQRSYDLLQINLYGFLQEWLIRLQS